jgi:hypothetical protein
MAADQDGGERGTTLTSGVSSFLGIPIFLSSRRRPGSISAMGTGLRRCDEDFLISEWSTMPDKASEWT